MKNIYQISYRAMLVCLFGSAAFFAGTQTITAQTVQPTILTSFPNAFAF